MKYKKVVKKVKSFKAEGLTREHILAAGIVLAIAVIGSYFIINSFASSPYADVEANSGTRTGAATLQGSGSDTNGQYVQFGSQTSSSCGSTLTAPSGYSSSQLIFDDPFCGTTLDNSKWNTYMGAAGGTWNDEGDFASPYSGPNSPANGGPGTDNEMYAPSQVMVDNGLTLTATRNTSGPTAQYANTSNGFATWLSGVVTTEGKFSLPSTGWYVQAKIKVPDMTQGMWPSMWFLPSGSGAYDELDDVQGGFIPCSGATDNYCPLTTGYFDSSGNNIGENNPNVGFDASAGYHIYGVQWTPGVGVNEYVDGNLVWSVTQSQVPGGIVAQAYEIIIDLQVANSKDSGWRTVPTASSPGGSLEVSEVQAYN